MYRKNNKKFIIVLLLFFFFMVNVGYAKIIDSSEISETSNVSNDLTLEFKNPKMESFAGINLRKTSCNIINNGKTLNVHVSELEYPGAGVEFSVDIVNSGNIKMTLDSINVTGIKNDSALKVKVLNRKQIANRILSPNEKCTVYFTVVWDYNNNNINNINDFEISFNYYQALYTK